VLVSALVLERKFNVIRLHRAWQFRFGTLHFFRIPKRTVFTLLFHYTTSRLNCQIACFYGLYAAAFCVFGENFFFRPNAISNTGLPLLCSAIFRKFFLIIAHPKSHLFIIGRTGFGLIISKISRGRL
jgi:hypothetical protein